MRIEVCPPERHRDAVWLLYSHLAPFERATQANVTMQSLDSGEIDPAGLFISAEGDAILGVVLASVMPGRLGTLWLPRLLFKNQTNLSLQLCYAADQFLADQDVPLCMAATQNDDDSDANLLVDAGYQRLAAILFLKSDRVDFPATRPQSDLTIRPFNSKEEVKLREVIEQTYEQTLDCPGLEGVRSIQDVLAGYRATGRHTPENWFLAESGNDDVGCLLLTDHPENDHFELIYMGILPKMRGQGFGVQLVRQAQWQTNMAGRESLVLAVDELNAPAIKLYAEAGFKQVGRQVIFQKTFARAQD